MLGPVLVHDGDGSVVDIRGVKPRMLLARLALAPGEVVSRDSVIDGLWGEVPPSDAGNALNVLVHRLRKALGDAGLVEAVGGGYRLRVAAADVDAHRFEVEVARGVRELEAGAVAEAVSRLGAALDLWRGAALTDVMAAPFAARAATRLEQLRLTAVENRFDGELRLGRHAEVLAELEAAVAEHPLWERLAALRMRALHAAGRQADALAGYETVRMALAEELGIDPSPQLQQARLAVLRGEAAPARPGTTAVPGRLPARLTGFVGRRDELESLGGLLATSRLVTVLGPGGAGKTRLAVETLSRHTAHRAGRAWLVPLASAEDETAVADAVLGALSSAEARPGPAGERLPDRVAELLGGDAAVVVLDNCEQVAPIVANLAGQLLERLPRLTILATSREPLEVVGEALCRLEPLPTPSPTTDVAGATGTDAVRLFVERAAAVRPGFAVTEANLAAVVEIVRQLDGLPLALELAAARMRAMDVGQIARRLTDRFRLLNAGNRSGQPHQRTLHAAIRWSWELLTEPERVLARRLSVFGGGFTDEAAEAIATDDELGDGEVAYLLASLVDKSIVTGVDSGYRMLATVRAFAAAEAGIEGERLRHRFTGYFARLAAEQEPLLRTPRQSRALAVVEAEYDNLVAALRFAIDDGDPTAAAGLLSLLHPYWSLLRFDARSHGLVSEVLGLGDGLPADARAAFTAFHALAAEAADLDPDRLRALVDDCAATGAMARYPMLLITILPAAHRFGLTDLVTREIDRARADGDAWPRAATYVVAAIIHYYQGDWEANAAARREFLAGFEATGDRLWTALALTAVAQADSMRGDNAAAVAGYRRSIALGAHDEIGHRLGLAVELLRSGDPATARLELNAAEQAARDAGRRLLLRQTLTVWAELHRRCGDVDLADAQLDRIAALTEADSLGDPQLADTIRFATRLTAGDPAGARALATAGIPAGEPAQSAELAARLLLLEDDPTGAAEALGIAHAIRGASDRGDVELRELVETLENQLGRSEYTAIFERGAELPRAAALERLGQL